MKYFFLMAVIILGLVPSGWAKFPQTVSTSGGRFQLVQLSDYRRDQYLLDTQTGNLWRINCYKPDPKDSTGCLSWGWEREPIEGITVSNKQYGQMFFKEANTPAPASISALVQESPSVKDAESPHEYVKTAEIGTFHAGACSTSKPIVDSGCRLYCENGYWAEDCK